MVTLGKEDSKDQLIIVVVSFVPADFFWQAIFNVIPSWGHAFCHFAHQHLLKRKK